MACFRHRAADDDCDVDGDDGGGGGGGGGGDDGDGYDDDNCASFVDWNKLLCTACL